MESTLYKFVNDQLSVWPFAAEHYRDLKQVRERKIRVNGLEVTVQHNPCRVVSSEAALDPASVRKRPCLLCPENLPPEQLHLEFDGRKGKRYRITLNPYPIFPSHLVVSSFEHTPQLIARRFQDMLDFVKTYPEYTAFYNGPASGASIPEHMHFQACPRGNMPLEVEADRVLDLPQAPELDFLTTVKEAELFHFKTFAKGIFLLRAKTAKSLTKLFYRLLDCAPVQAGETEPRFNLYTWTADGGYRALVLFRVQHRSSHYSATAADHLAMSPGCADMAGLFIAPRIEDFEKLDARLLGEMIREVTIDQADEQAIRWRLERTQPKLEVGILSGAEIEFEILSDGAGPQRVSYSQGKISYNGVLYDELTFEAPTLSTMFAEPAFVLYGVTIGVDFHWERKVTQQFAGTLKFIVEAGKVTAVNCIGVEDYLLSVISSEMKSSASLEFLKAHAVISRSWVMAQIAHRGQRESILSDAELKALNNVPALVTRLDADRDAGNPEGESASFIKWFDHDDHKHFDVCADDHCQRYQGLTMAVGDTVRQAIDQTWGLVLRSEGEICDARFSKCCGGVMERFSTCWEDREYPYLRPLADTPAEGPVPDLTTEAGARAWILADPEAFCNTSDAGILSQVLNDYDLETKDFFRWRVSYGREELSELIRRRSGMDFGLLHALMPIERGPSGRLLRLEVVGSQKCMVIGKELIIRRFLSENHLKSSAFIVTYLDADGKEVPTGEVEDAARAGKSPAWSQVLLRGAGWGHGVGLCQIGAAVMSCRGYDFRSILLHYYPGSELATL